MEHKPEGDVPDLSMHALQKRIRQQEILSELGVTALQGAPFEQLLSDTARLTAEGLETEFCKVLEYIPSQNKLLVRAGVGWKPGIVGVATIGADLASPAGFALQTGKPVISNHLENEERFRTPEILRQHGIYRAMNVILQGDGKPFGVLEVDSRSDNEFEQRDLAFLQGAANILGMAIERERNERKLKAALDRHQFLLREMNHRVKNSLQIVASMLALQSRDVADVELEAHLNEASYRVAAVARAHEQLSHSPGIERMDIGKYINTICRDLDASAAHCEVYTDTDDGIVIETDRAISIALIVNELITNCAKYAYKGRSGGKVWVKVARTDKLRFAISVRDEGTGLPVDFNFRQAKGLGMRIISAFISQLGAELAVHPLAPGTEFVLTVPVLTSS
ncbi:MAG: GAF domain-containing protein [Pseudomonadota bacterium]|nr:GAF domain-containing protein [Pseudomonadota bacterium]